MFDEAIAFTRPGIFLKSKSMDAKDEHQQEWASVGSRAAYHT